MSTVRIGQSNVAHEENRFDSSKTLCGRPIPAQGKEWSAYGQVTCKACKRAKERAIRAQENAEHHNYAFGYDY